MYLKNIRENMIHGINNKTYYNMEQYVDMEAFEKMQPEILTGFALARDLEWVLVLLGGGLGVRVGFRLLVRDVQAGCLVVGVCLGDSW